MRLQTQVEPEIQKRLLLSRVEAESLKERDILCPTCGFRIQRVQKQGQYIRLEIQH